jgi:hypothetical protein
MHRLLAVLLPVRLRRQSTAGFGNCKIEERGCVRHEGFVGALCALRLATGHLASCRGELPIQRGILLPEPEALYGSRPGIGTPDADNFHRFGSGRIATPS